jgi:hypothetical protein
MTLSHVVHCSEHAVLLSGLSSSLSVTSAGTLHLLHSLDCFEVRNDEKIVERGRRGNVMKGSTRLYVPRSRSSIDFPGMVLAIKSRQAPLDMVLFGKAEIGTLEP